MANFLLEELTILDVYKALDLLANRDGNEAMFRSHYIIHKGKNIGIKMAAYAAIGIKNGWDVSEKDMVKLQDILLDEICAVQGHYFHTNKVVKKFNELGVTVVKDKKN